MSGNGIWGKIWVFFICCTFGFLLTLQLRSVSITDRSAADNENLRAAELTLLLAAEREKNQSLRENVAIYRDELEKYRAAALESGDYAELLEDTLLSMEMLAGRVDVKGPGVSITIESMGTDAKNQITVDDILRIINELNLAGAEAMSLCGERVTSFSYIDMNGSSIMVNSKSYLAPYTIEAIGDPERLYSAINAKNGIADTLWNSWRIRVAVTPLEEVLVRAYEGSAKYRYAEPALPQIGDQPRDDTENEIITVPVRAEVPAV